MKTCKTFMLATIFSFVLLVAGIVPSRPAGAGENSPPGSPAPSSEQAVKTPTAPTGSTSPDIAVTRPPQSTGRPLGSVPCPDGGPPPCEVAVHK
jgi:hypothetical protein